jgi:hypothetical protein
VSDRDASSSWNGSCGAALLMMKNLETRSSKFWKQPRREHTGKATQGAKGKMSHGHY